MKKLLITLGIVLGVSLIGVEKANAQPIVYYSNRCCDASDQMRCLQVNMTPIGSVCYCPYQGWGHTC